MSTIKERIKQLRKEKDLTQEELAKLLGLSAKSNIANYENGANAPSDEIKLKMCELFDCSMDYLMGKSEYKNKEDEMNAYLDVYHNAFFSKAIFETRELFKDIPITIDDLQEISHTVSQVAIEKDAEEGSKILEKYIYKYVEKGRTDEEKKKIYSALLVFFNKSMESIYSEINNNKSDEQEQSNIFPLADTPVSVPVLGKISAGLPLLATEHIEGYEFAPSSYIKEGFDYFYLRVNGDSMNLKFNDGDIVLVQKQDNLENDEIGVVLVDGMDATVKKYKYENGLVILSPMSTNPEHVVQIYNPKDISIRIVGKVVSYQGRI